MTFYSAVLCHILHQLAVGRDAAVGMYVRVSLDLCQITFYLIIATLLVILFCCAVVLFGGLESHSRWSVGMLSNLNFLPEIKLVSNTDLSSKILLCTTVLFK